MQNFKKMSSFIILGISLICMIFFFAIFFGNNITIYEFNAEVTLNEKGDMEVVESWDMKYSGDYNVRFRDIKYGKYNLGNPLHQEITNVAQFDTASGYSVKVFDKNHNDVTGRVGYSFKGDVDELGVPLKNPYHANEEVLFVDMTNQGGLKGRFTFEYTYTILGAVTQYSDISELNWIFLDYAEATVKKSTINIHLPSNNHHFSEVSCWGHGLSKGFITIVDNSNINIEMKNISFSTSEFSVSENIEIRVLAQNSLFPNVSEINKVIKPAKISRVIITDYEINLANETNRKITIANIILYGSIVTVLAMGVIIFFVYKKYDKEYDSKFKEKYLHDPPSDLSPAQMSYLYYFRKTNDEDVTATLLDLIRRKYLKIVLIDDFMTEKEASFKISLDKEKNLLDLLPHEAHLINWFIKTIGDGSSVTNKAIEKYGDSYKNAETFTSDGLQFKRLVKNSCKDKDFFETKTSEKAAIFSYALIPIFVLIISMVVSAYYNIISTFPMALLFISIVVYLIYVSTIKKRSINGNEEYAKWKSFRNFLVDFGTFKDYPMPGIVIWEKFLVYATSFKIADLVMKQLEVKLPQLTEDSNATYLAMAYPRYHFGFMMYNMNRTMSRARSTVQQTTVRHNQSRVGGAGGGGGFGGGSSFGGGGGGGRSR